MKVTLPTVHLNGTSREGLQAQIETAVRALETAKEALAAARPHGRDYYVQGDGATQKAINEHAWREQRVAEVQAELAKIWEHLQ